MGNEFKKRKEMSNLSDVELCPICGSEDIGCIDSRKMTMRRRIRKCNECDYRFKTYEINEDDLIRLLENNHNYCNLRFGLRKVCEFL